MIGEAEDKGVEINDVDGARSARWSIPCTSSSARSGAPTSSPRCARRPASRSSRVAARRTVRVLRLAAFQPDRFRSDAMQRLGGWITGFFGDGVPWSLRDRHRPWRHRPLSRHLTGVTWSFEMVGMLFLWVTAIGAVLAEIAGENVSIDGNSSTSGRGPRLPALPRRHPALGARRLPVERLGHARPHRFRPDPVMRAPIVGRPLDHRLHGGWACGSSHRPHRPFR